MSARSETYSLVVKRRLLTPAVEEARESLKLALGDAIAQSGLYRGEAEGRLSLFLAYLWDDFEPVLHQLPEQKGRSGSLGLDFTKPKPADLGLTSEAKKRKAGHPREDGVTRMEERLSL